MNAPEKFLAIAIRKSLQAEGWLNLALFIAAGVLGPQINRHISLIENLALAAVGVLITQFAILRSSEDRYPTNVKRSMKSGFTVGARRGLALGAIVGLHGGVEDFGFWWCVTGCTLLFAVSNAVVNPLCDRMLTDGVAGIKRT